MATYLSGYHSHGILHKIYISISRFDPKYADIVSEPMVVSNIVEQLKYNDILLEPDFRLEKEWRRYVFQRKCAYLLVKQIA